MPLCQRDGPCLCFGTPLREGQKRGGLKVASRDCGRRNNRTLTIRLVRAIAPRCAAELHQDTLPRLSRANTIRPLFAVACNDGLEQGKLKVRLAPFEVCTVFA